MKVPQLITESYLSKWKTNSFLSAMLWAAMGLVLIVIRDQVHYSTCYLLGLILPGRTGGGLIFCGKRGSSGAELHDADTQGCR